MIEAIRRLVVTDSGLNLICCWRAKWYTGLGDAWGGHTKGGSSNRIFEVPSRLVLSCDTQLTLATCHAIVEAGCVKPEIIAAATYTGFGPGKFAVSARAQLKAMRDLDAGMGWAVAGARASTPPEMEPRCV